jgi:dTDP-4-amino-4,6-dideoxygalactose transaminase
MYDIGTKEIEAVRRVIKRGGFFRYGGPETSGFETEWAKLMDCKSVVTVTSGTAALITCLKAMGIGPGDSVLVPGYTFVSTALAVTAVGAIPIYTEVDETMAMDPVDVERKIESHTACLLPVHMMGTPCNMRALKRIAKKHGLLILEDTCQGIGGSFGGKRLGTIGDMGAYSFNQFKILSCSVWPQTGKMDEAFYCGGNFRTNEIACAVLREQVKRLPGILRDLRRTRKQIQRGLKLPEGYRVIETHDEEGNCGVCTLVQADTIKMAEKLQETLGPWLGGWRPINSGRHVYKHWDVVNDRVGGHHKDWDCFKHPKNKKIKTNYRKALKQSDDFMSRTCMLLVPYQYNRDKTEKLLKKVNAALAKM